MAQRETVAKLYSCLLEQMIYKCEVVCCFPFKLTIPFLPPPPLSSSSRGISFEIPLDGDPTVPPCEAPSLRGMTRSASSDGLGFKVHFASRGGMKRHLSLVPVNVNGQSRHIPEEEEDFASHRLLGRNNTFSVKNQSRYRRGMCCDLLKLSRTDTKS